jgi:hypothetical protein
MQLTRRGYFRDCGPKVLIKEEDGEATVRGHPAGAKMSIAAARGEGASYQYGLKLEPKEVLRCLLVLEPDMITEALRSLRDEFNLAEIVPELHRQLALGSVPPQPAEEEVEEAESLFS